MSTPLSQLLSNLNATLSLSLGIVHVVFGTVGTLLNLFVYTRSSTWRTSCGLFLAVSYISAYGVIMAGQFPRLILPAPSFLLTTFWQCQIRGYLVQVLGFITRACIVLAALDRLLLCSTQVRRRQWCDIRRARWMILLVILVAFVLHIHMPVTHEYRPIPRVCYSSLDWLITLDFVYQLLFVGTIPGGLIALFSIRLIIALRHQRLRLARELRTRDKQLTWMLLTQVIVYMVIHTIVLANMTYGRITLNETKTRDRSAIENFITFLINSQLVYVYFSMTFVFNVLSSPIFRKDLIYFWKKIDSRTIFVRTTAQVAPSHPTNPVTKSAVSRK